MKHDDFDTAPAPGRRMIGLAAKLAFALAAAVAAPLAIAAGLGFAAGAVLGALLAAGLFLYLVRTIVRPLRMNARLAGRLAAGDCGGDVPGGQTARNDEVGDLSRAIRDAIARRRDEAGMANDMSAGDFTGAAAARDPADEFGLAVRRMAVAAMETLRRIDLHAEQVMAGCEAIASASGALSADSSGTAAAVSEITDGVALIRERADGNAGMAEQAGSLADAGCRAIGRGYGDIGEMGLVMLNMQVCGDKIVRIAKSISDIAFQTNLLALNANVEAARAGRHGKGFTIVAEEVRRLSVRTSQAAEETSTLMKETIGQVELAAAVAGRINAALSEVESNNKETNALLARIAADSRGQSGGIDRISDALRRVDQSARKNMEHVGDMARMAGDMAGRTGGLRRAMERFRPDFRRPPDPGPSAGSEEDVRLLQGNIESPFYDRR